MAVVFGLLQIMEISTAKTGKHGHAKCSITGICQLTGKKVEDSQPSHAHMYAAEIKKTEYTLTYLDEAANEVQCLDQNQQEVTLPLTGCPVEEKLKTEYDPNDADNEIIVTVITAPTFQGANVDSLKKNEMVVSFKKQKCQD